MSDSFDRNHGRRPRVGHVPFDARAQFASRHAGQSGDAGGVLGRNPAALHPTVDLLLDNAQPFSQRRLAAYDSGSAQNGIVFSVHASQSTPR